VQPLTTGDSGYAVSAVSRAAFLVSLGPRYLLSLGCVSLRYAGCQLQSKTSIKTFQVVFETVFSRENKALNNFAFAAQHPLQSS
jgi:hypothetical protein